MNNATAQSTEASTEASKLKALLSQELEQRYPDDLEVGRFELENEWQHHFEFGDQELIEALLEDETLLTRFVDSFLENVDHLSKASSISLEIEQMLMGLCEKVAEV